MPGRSCRALTLDEAEVAARHRMLAFGDKGTDREADVQRLGRRIAANQVVGLFDGSRLLGHCRVLTVDHWFGGRRVPAQHIAAVAVPPEHRGAGVASALMRSVLHQGQRENLGLSLLFPATTRLYRGLGWEHAGSLCSYRVDARAVPAIGPALRPLAGDSDWAAVVACHERAGAGTAGLAVRDQERWESMRDAAFAYGLDGRDGELDAYVVFDHSFAADDWQYTLEIHDWAALTPAGLQGVVGLVGRHGSIGKDATYPGGVPNPWALVLPEQDSNPDWGMYWMARGLDLPAAIAARGFPADLALRVTFAVDDPDLPAARGPWLLVVRDGRGQLTRHPEADATMHARGFGPLYTGFRSPHELGVAGLLQGSDATLRALGAAFAGPHPVLYDFF